MRWLIILLALVAPARAMERTILHAEGSWGVYVNFDGAAGTGRAFLIGKGNREASHLGIPCVIGQGDPTLFYVQIRMRSPQGTFIRVRNDATGERLDFPASIRDVQPPDLYWVANMGEVPTSSLIRMISHDLIVSAGGLSMLVSFEGYTSSSQIFDRFCRARNPAATVACLVRQPLHASSGSQCPQ